MLNEILEKTGSSEKYGLNNQNYQIQIKEDKWDKRNFRGSLRQWKMLHTVVRCGSFSGAAEALHVTQPAISYAIGKLEDQIGVSLLKLEGRRAIVTDAGRTLLERVRYLLHEASELEDLADNLRLGWRSEVKLVLSHEFPISLVIPIIQSFTSYTGSAHVQVMEVASSKIDSLIVGGTIDLAVCAQAAPGLSALPLIDLEYVAVAHPKSNLFSLQRELSQNDLKKVTRIVSATELYAHSTMEANAARAGQQWIVSNYDNVARVLAEGIGYGWLPRHYVEDLLGSGYLKMLPIQQRLAYRSTFYLVSANTRGTENHEVTRLSELLLNELKRTS